VEIIQVFKLCTAPGEGRTPSEIVCISIVSVLKSCSSPDFL
jgi:hypothetical protein